MKLSWLDVRHLGAPVRNAVIEEGLHQHVHSIVSDDLAVLEGLPPTVEKVFMPGPDPIPADLGDATIIILDTHHPAPADLADQYPERRFGRFVEVVDTATLEKACEASRTQAWTILTFRDPTKIPLEIVIAASAGAAGSIVTTAADVTEARVLAGVLEHGSDGIMLAPRAVGEITALVTAAASHSQTLQLVELTITATTHVGMGERACVDTCSYFRQNEGLLVGSHSKGMVLCVSETHPLPYMPTRPFRVNAGAIHSYTLSVDERTNYLSELRAGSPVMAVDADGNTRLVIVGRVKIETRPLISIDATASDGTAVNLVLQDDWHVRVLGPGAVVLNSTELRPGDTVLGFLPDKDRHVGYPIDEFCLEQ